MKDSRVAILNEGQRARALELLNLYLLAPKDEEGKTPLQNDEILDSERFEVIESELKTVLKKFFEGSLELAGFKTKIDSINKRHECWGFKGIKGQMFFNQLVNAAAEQHNECAAELRSVLSLPQTEDHCKSRLRTFLLYVQRIGEELVQGGGSKASKPKLSSVPFFVSYFWQLLAPTIWPVQYTNSVNTLTDINFFQPTGDHVSDYITFKHLHEELAELFSQHNERTFSLYDVEHWLWFLDHSKDSPPPKPTPSVTQKNESKTTVAHDSYVPPIVAILPSLARNDETTVEALESAGISASRAFEKSIHACFTIMGFETQLLGQGSGRVPDGVAINRDDSYAILWDAKIRADNYRMGTDDRAIREYVSSQSALLKKRNHLRNIYYCIVSSRFMASFEDSISVLKMETHVNEVVLIEAGALVELVDAKLRNPIVLSLGSDGMQQLFCKSGILTAELVKEILS